MPTVTEVGVPDGITQLIVRGVIPTGVVMMDARAMIVIRVTVPTHFAVTILGVRIMSVVPLVSETPSGQL